MNNQPIVATKWSDWTIDRERNIILVLLGGQGFDDSEIPAFGVLVIGGEQIPITYRHGGTGNSLKGIRKWYDIEQVNTPQKIDELYTTNELKNLIVEAFAQDAYGVDNDRPILEVNVTFGNRTRGE